MNSLFRIGHVLSACLERFKLNHSVSSIPDRSEIDIDLIFGTTADKSYHDLVIQNGKTSPIMNSTSPQSKGFGSSYMTNTGLRGINYTV